MHKDLLLWFTTIILYILGQLVGILFFCAKKAQ